MLQSLPLTFLKSIVGSLQQDSLFVSITSLDEDNKMITITSTRIMDVHKKQNFIVYVHTSTQLVKPAWPSKPIFFIATLLTADDAGWAS